MSNFRSFSPSTMLSTSSIVWQNVTLTDELKIGLEYDIQQGLLNIFVKNNGATNTLPCHINVLSNRFSERDFISKNNSKDMIMFDDCYHSASSHVQQDRDEDLSASDEEDNLESIIFEQDEPKICIELSTIYTYDLVDEIDDIDESNPCRSLTMVTSPSFSSSSSSYFDDDDGYSTHSQEDIEQQPTPSSNLIMLSSAHRYRCQSYLSKQYTSSMRRLIGQLMWLNPFHKTMQQMMMNHV